MNIKDIKTPAYVIDKPALIKNLKILKGIEERTGCHILLAQKCFSNFSLYPLIGEYISGTTASGLYEARLGYEEMNKEKDQKREKKYFQSKEYEDSDKVFGIKADHSKINREADDEDDDDKYSKCHERKHKQGKGKCHHKHRKDKCKCHHKHGKDKCKCHHKHKKIVFNIEFSPAEELLNYAELLEKGYITKEEFEKKKEELLNIEYKI